MKFNLRICITCLLIVYCKNTYSLNNDSKVLSDTISLIIDSNHIEIIDLSKIRPKIRSKEFLNCINDYKFSLISNINLDSLGVNLWAKVKIDSLNNYNSYCLVKSSENWKAYILNDSLGIIDSIYKYSGFVEDSAVNYVFKIPNRRPVYYLLYNVDRNSQLFKNKKIKIVNTLNIYETIIKNNEFSLSKPKYYNLLLFGIILFCSFTSLIFYYLDKEKIYLNIFILILFTGLFRFLSKIYDIIPSETISIFISISISICIYTLFVNWYLMIRNGLGIKKYYPKWDKWMYIANYLLLPLGIIILFIPGIIDIILYGDQMYRTTLYSKKLVFYLITFIDGIIYILFFSIIIYLVLKTKKFSSNETYKLLLYVIPMFIWIMILGPLSFLISKKMDWYENLGWLGDLLIILPSIGLVLKMLKNYNFQKRSLIKSIEEKHLLQIDKERTINQIISEKNIELDDLVKIRTNELVITINSLKDTQAKLIHSEKMASLGALTAGIAHEIQNPLNFINNFSEINIEFVNELAAYTEPSQDYFHSLAVSIKENSKKILDHGKRADSIVKNMLQHSRRNAGMISDTDVNTLLEECWRLSYHGFRDKDRSFKVHTNLDLDMSMGRINVNAEELGRAFINLINNALYTIHEKWKRNVDNTDYVPTIELITLEINGGCAIKIIDNGTGIPDAIKDEIFNPFFTTKPSGQGVGLGLSLVYDIITKGHNGKIEFQSKVDVGTTFTINLPKG